MADEGRGGTLGFWATWAMAVGGMIGGGIFSAMGVVIEQAGAWAWASFALGGLVALATGHSYARLTVKLDRGGGAFAFLRSLGHPGAARVAAWALIGGYTLTVAVYGFTFGAYLSHALNGPAWLAPLAAVAAIGALAALNLLDAGTSSTAEVVSVCGNLLILLTLAAIGLARWAPERLAGGSGAGGPMGVLVGAASVFMVYEGFQLLAYDYEDMTDRKALMPRVMPVAIGTSIAVYIAVVLGAATLVGGDTLVAQKEVALAAAGRAAAGTLGFWGVTAAAVFATGSAINSTLFATARLAREAASEHELPALFGRENGRGAPWVGVLAIAAAAAALALVGGLSSLVQGASVVFLAVFALVNAIAVRRGIAHALVGWFGAGGAGAAVALLGLHLAGAV